MTAKNIPAWMVGRPRPIGLPAGEDPNRKLTAQENVLASLMMQAIPTPSLMAYLEDAKFPQPQTLEQLFAFNEWLDEQKLMNPPVDNETKLARMLGE